MAGITDGQAVAAAETNAAFLAKNGDDVATGKITLANADSATITDLQATVNGFVDDVAAINASIGAADGIASLDSGGKVPASQLPSYVDDVLEYADFASLPASGTASIIYVTLDTNKTYRWSGSAYVEISQSEVTLAGTQVLTNKDIDGGTASNTSRITLPKASKSTLDGLTRKEATLVYASDEKKAYVDDGTTLVAVGTGSGGGGTNFLTATDGSTIGSIAAYADAAGTSPVDGTGGSPNSTIAVSTDSSLVGGSNFLWTKSGSANRQGEGWSEPFTIDAAYQAKPCTFSALYKIASGSYSDGDLSVWIYDVTNGVLIQPTGYKILNVGGVGQIKAEFQTAYNSTSYRLIIHTASTSTADYTIRFDALSISPNTYSYGACVTDWTSYTPTGTWATNTSYSGKYRRVGDSVQVKARATLSGAPTGTFSLNLPTGLVIDTSKLPSTTEEARLGGGLVRDSGAASYDTVDVIYSSTTAVTVNVGGLSTFSGSQYTKALAPVTASSPFTFGSGDYIEIEFSVPILGWGTSQVLSSETDTRVVSFSGTKSSTQAVTADVTNVSFNVEKDSNGGWNASTNAYVVQVPGDHDVSAVYADNGTASITFKVYVNGVFKKPLPTGYAGQYGGGTALIPNLVAGDQITLRCNTSTTLSPVGNCSIKRLSGPAQIAASEKIIAKYRLTSGYSITANDYFNYGTKVKDSHGAVTTGTGTSWKFVCPAPGDYKMVINARDIGVAVSYILMRNGVEIDYVMLMPSTTDRRTASGTITDCVAGDQLAVRLNASGTVLSDSSSQVVTITRET